MAVAAVQANCLLYLVMDGATLKPRRTLFMTMPGLSRGLVGLLSIFEQVTKYLHSFVFVKKSSVMNFLKLFRQNHVL